MILNDCSICMCLYVYVCVNFKEEIIFGEGGGGDVKPGKNQIFVKNGKTVNCFYSTG